MTWRHESISIYMGTYNRLHNVYIQAYRRDRQRETERTETYIQRQRIHICI